MILYTKFSNDRAAAFAIRTGIAEEAGMRCVRKYPAGAEALPHIRSLPVKEEALKKAFGQSGFVPNRCFEEQESVRFEYLTGDTLEMQLDRLLDRDPEKAGRALVSFTERIRSLASEPFEETPAFREVFGTIGQITPENAFCAAVSDIDLVPANILPDGERLQVIDYEWTFFFPVPVGFLIWRAVHYYIAGSSKRACLAEENLLRKAGVPKAETAGYAAMEEAFQRYVTGENIPLWKLWPEMTPGYINVIDVLESARKRTVRTPGKVYFDRGSGFREEDAVLTRAASDGTMSFEVPLAGLRAFRIDPAEEDCVVTIVSESIPGLLMSGTMNGSGVSREKAVFTGTDPNIVIRHIPKGESVYRCVLALDASEKEVQRQVREAYDAFRREKEQKSWKGRVKDFSEHVRSIHKS